MNLTANYNKKLEIKNIREIRIRCYQKTKKETSRGHL